MFDIEMLNSEAGREMIEQIQKLLEMAANMQAVSESTMEGQEVPQSQKPSENTDTQPNTNQQQAVLPPLPAPSMQLIDCILQLCGYPVDIVALIENANATQERYRKLLDQYAHSQEIITMLTRYRFAPHSEQKQRLSRVMKDIVKLIDQEELIPPEFSDVDPEKIAKLRSGELVLINDGNGRYVILPAPSESGEEQGKPPVSGKEPEPVIVIPQPPANGGQGTDHLDKAPSGKSQETPPQETVNPNGKPGNASQEEQNSGGEQNTTEETKPAPGKHARRTKGSLDKKFANVEHIKCYTAFDDQTGMQDHPPLDSQGRPMVYMGERYVRQILVRIPAKFVLYECYSQTFRSMNSEEAAAYALEHPEQSAGEVTEEVPATTPIPDENTPGSGLDGKIMVISDLGEEGLKEIADLEDIDSLEGLEVLDTDDLEILETDETERAVVKDDSLFDDEIIEATEEDLEETVYIIGDVADPVHIVTEEGVPDANDRLPETALPLEPEGKHVEGGRDQEIIESTQQKDAVIWPIGQEQAQGMPPIIVAPRSPLDPGFQLHGKEGMDAAQCAWPSPGMNIVPESSKVSWEVHELWVDPFTPLPKSDLQQRNQDLADLSQQDQQSTAREPCAQGSNTS